MSDVLLRIADPAVGVVLAGCGSVLWVRRPRSLVGPLMLVAAGCWFLGSLWVVAVFLHRGPLVHLHISYPTGRMRRPLAIVTVICAYAVSIGEAIGANPWVTLAMAVLVAVAAADIYARTSGPARKAGGPALGAALTFASVLALSSANQLLMWENDRLVLLLYDVAICVVALVLSADLLWGRWTEATVADFVTQVGARPDLDTLTGALQDALGDPSVALGYWLPDQRRYVDDAGAIARVAGGSIRSRVVIRVDEARRARRRVDQGRGPSHQDERPCSPTSRPPSDSRSAMRASAPRCEPTSPSSASRVAAWSRRPMVSAGSWSPSSTEDPGACCPETSRLLENVDDRAEAQLAGEADAAAGRTHHGARRAAQSGARDPASRAGVGRAGRRPSAPRPAGRAGPGGPNRARRTAATSRRGRRLLCLRRSPHQHRQARQGDPGVCGDNRRPPSRGSPNR